MRYLLTGVMVMFAVAALAADYNESVAAISYNPSRLGAYSHLKIAKTAVLRAIDAQTNSAEVNIMTKGTVSVKNGGNCTSGQACHQITEIVPLAGSGYTNSNFYEGSNDNFTATLQTESGTLVQGGNTPYQGNIPSISGDSYNVQFPSSAAGTNLELSAGTFSAVSGSNAFVKTLNATLAQLHLEAGTLIMNGSTFKVEGNGATFVVGRFNGSGGTTISAASSKSTFTWHKRVDEDAKEAKVLAVR